MPIKDVVVFYGRDAGQAIRLEMALSVARRFDAHLVGVYAMGYPAIAAAGGAGGGMAVTPQLVEAEYQAMRQTASEAEKSFQAAMTREGRAGEWRLLEGDAIDVMTLAARHADIAVVGQANPDEPGPYDRMADNLVVAAGRPVLVAPYVGMAEDFGRRILVAWNGSREATRALHDALPFLKRAEEVVVSRIDPSEDEVAEAVDIGAHLARHGVKVTANDMVAPDIDVGPALLSAAADNGIDLLVMGGYGHSRLRELALGGATRHLLRSMTVPVLMSH